MNTTTTQLLTFKLLILTNSNMASFKVNKSTNINVVIPARRLLHGSCYGDVICEAGRRNRILGKVIFDRKKTSQILRSNLYAKCALNVNLPRLLIYTPRMVLFQLCKNEMGRSKGSAASSFRKKTLSKTLSFCVQVPNVAICLAYTLCKF